MKGNATGVASRDVFDGAWDDDAFVNYGMHHRQSRSAFRQALWRLSSSKHGVCLADGVLGGADEFDSGCDVGWISRRGFFGAVEISKCVSQFFLGFDQMSGIFHDHSFWSEETMERMCDLRRRRSVWPFSWKEIPAF
jgi:hypothetical protein